MQEGAHGGRGATRTWPAGAGGDAALEAATPCVFAAPAEPLAARSGTAGAPSAVASAVTPTAGAGAEPLTGAQAFAQAGP